jgi:hypothetical protein
VCFTVTVPELVGAGAGLVEYVPLDDPAELEPLLRRVVEPVERLGAEGA